MQFDSASRPAAVLRLASPTFRRLRRPTPAPCMRRGGWSNYLARLSWLFG
jgi:hypothetical protein